MILSSKIFRTLLLASTLSLVLFQQPLQASSATDPQSFATDFAPGSRLLPGQAQSGPGKTDSVNLKGIISLYDGPPPDQLLGNLVSTALLRDEAHEALLKKDKQMKGSVHGIIDRARMSAQFMTAYRGFEMSS